MADRPDYAPLIAAERTALEADLASLPPESWDVPTLCEGWTVRNVAAHLASGDEMNPLILLATLLAAGFSVDKTNQAMVQRWSQRDPADLCREVGRPRPRGLLRLMPAAALSEVFLHGQDIRRPLGLPPHHSEEVLRAMADATCTRRLSTGALERIRGVRLVATDIEWSSGEGPEVRGPAEALIMAAHGRRAALEDLQGEGLELLRAR